MFRELFCQRKILRFEISISWKVEKNTYKNDPFFAPFQRSFHGFLNFADLVMFSLFWDGVLQHKCQEEAKQRVSHTLWGIHISHHLTFWWVAWSLFLHQI